MRFNIRSALVKSLTIFAGFLLLSACSINGAIISTSLNVNKKDSGYKPSGSFLALTQLGMNLTTTVGEWVATDINGNVFIAGDTNANLVSCLGVAANCVGSSQGNKDFFITKYDSNGNWLWTQQLGETLKTNTSEGIGTDLAGNVYIVGSTNGNLLSCFGVSATCSGTSQGNIDAFLVKYNSAGVWQWTQQLGESLQSALHTGIYVNPTNGDVAVTGNTSGYLPSCGGVSASCVGNSQATPNGDYFVSKYNTAGLWQWTKQLGQTGHRSAASYVTMDSLGNVIVAGTTTANLPACGGTSGVCAGTAKGAKDYFITKYSSLGAWQWTQQLGETAATAGVDGVVTDTTNNIYVTGSVAGGNLVSCGGISANCLGTSTGNTDFILAKYSPAGGYLWLQQLGESATTTIGYSLAIDALGDIYTAGSTQAYLPSCNGVSANCTGLAQGAADYFLVKYKQ